MVNNVKHSAMFRVLAIWAIFGSSLAFAEDSLSDKVAALQKIVATQQGLITKLQTAVSHPPVYLSDLPFISALPNDPNSPTYPQRDKVYWNNIITASDGSRYLKALGMHPPYFGTSQVDIAVPDGYNVFKTLLVDVDTCSPQGIYSYHVLLKKKGEAAFKEIYGTATVLKSSVELKLDNPDILRLTTDSAGANNCDHATFAEPQFLSR